MTGQPRTRLIPGLTHCQAVRSGFLRLRRFILGERHSRQATRGGGGGGHAWSAVTAACRGCPAPPLRRPAVGGPRAVSSRARGAVTGSRVEARVAEEEPGWSRDAGELAACFTVHARDLFGYACVLSGADRPWPAISSRPRSRRPPPSGARYAACPLISAVTGCGRHWPPRPSAGRVIRLAARPSPRRSGGSPS